MPKKLDIYYSFRSPYSYLAIDRLIKIVEKYALDYDFKIVRPLALREDNFFKNARPQFVPYLIRDVKREADRLSIPFMVPTPDPIVMDMQTGIVAKDQPYIEQLMGLGMAAIESGNALLYAKQVGFAVWSSGQDWTRPDCLPDIAKGLGLDHAQLEAWRHDNADLIAARIHENEKEQVLYHWGVPLMVLDGEPFFGQDRLDTLEWRLSQD